MNIRIAAVVLFTAVSAFASGERTIKLEPYRNTVALHATVAGHEGFFVFDTGAGVSVMTPQFAKAIGCEPHGQITGFAMFGNKMQSPRCEDVAVAIGGQTFTAPVVTVFDIMKMYPPDAPPIDGLIGLNVFDGKAITIDFPAKTLTIESAASLRKRTRGATEVPARIAREVQGLALSIAVGVPVKNGHVWMEVDSGNSRTIFVSKAFAPMLGLDPATKEPQKADLAIAGPIHIRGPVFAADIILDGNLGMPFLKDAVVTIDFVSGRMWMRVQSAAP